MERKVAGKLMKILMGSDKPLNEASALVEQIDNKKEKRQLR
jgi:hypothetical protein